MRVKYYLYKWYMVYKYYKYYSIMNSIIQANQMTTRFFIKHKLDIWYYDKTIIKPKRRAQL